MGPALDAAREAASDLDATLLYATTLRPCDEAGLRQAMTGTDIAIVEQALEGTPDEHNAAHGLDARGIRDRIDVWLGSGGRP